MLVIKEVSAEGIPVLGTYKLRLDKYPLMVIRGNNLDKINKKGSSNGSGKTMSLSPIPTLVFETSPTSLKKKASKDLLQKKGSFIQMTLNDGKERVIRKQLVSSIKHFITTDGEVSSYRKPEEARAAIRSLFPMSEEAFYSQLFIDGRQKSILQTGTAAQRFTYLETIFQLNEYDQLNVLASQDYNHTKRLIQELGVLAAEKKDRKLTLPAVDAKKLKAKHEQIQADLEKYSQRVEKYIELHNNTKTYLSLVEDLDTSKSLENLHEELEEANEELVTMNKLYKKSIRHYEALEQQEALRGRRQRLKAAIKDIPGDIEMVPEIDGKIQKLTRKLKVVETALEEAEDNNRIYKTARARLKMMDITEIPEKYKDKTEKQLERLKVANDYLQKEKVEAKKNLIDFIEHDHGGQNCPVCQRGFSKKTAKLVVESLDKTISLCVRKGAHLDAYMKIKRYTQEMEDHPFIAEDEFQIKRNKYNDLIEKYDATLEGLRRKENLMQRLADLPKADTVEDHTIPKPMVYEDTIKDLNTRISDIETAIKAHKRIARLGYQFESVEAVRAKNEAYKTKLSEYRPVLQQLQQDLSDVVSKESVYNSIAEDINRLVVKINALKLDTKDFKIFEALRKAFGNRGLRKIKTRYYVSQLQNSFNKFAPFIFGEPVTFQFQITDTQFDILYEMGGVIKDARKLSGAESTCFTLLLILSILPFIPAHMRTNLIVLDEIEIGMDDGAKEKFVNDFLPILQKVVKNIILITPMSEQKFYIPNAKTLLVTKKGGQSTIKMISPGV